MHGARACWTCGVAGRDVMRARGGAMRTRHSPAPARAERTGTGPRSTF